MSVYVITFALSLFCYGIALRVRQKFFRYVFLFLCVFVPALLAGLRDVSCGTDLGGYGIKIWNLAAHSDSFISFKSSVRDIEFVYLLLNYIVSRFTLDVHWFLFILAIIVMTLVVWSAQKYRNAMNSVFVLFFFYLYLYCACFSMLRQSIALALILLTSAFIFEKKIKISLIPFALACLSHSSAFFAVLLYLFQIIVEKKFDQKCKLFVIVVAVGILGFSFYATIIYWLMNMGLYSDHYEAYIGQEGFKTHKVDLVVIAGLVVSLFCCVKRKDRIEPFFSYSLFLLIIAFILNLYGSIVEIAVRIGHYFMLPLAFLIPLSAKKGLSRQKIELATLFLLFVQFVYLAITTGIQASIPYKSQILNFRLFF